jgi:hypothetical protein
MVVVHGCEDGQRSLAWLPLLLVVNFGWIDCDYGDVIVDLELVAGTGCGVAVGSDGLKVVDW